MLFYRIAYFYYLFTSRKLFKRTKSGLLSGETLVSLKNRMKFNGPVEYKTVSVLNTEHLDLGTTLMDVLQKFSKPVYMNANKTAGVKHHRLVYSDFRYGLPAYVMYNFINGQIASVSFDIATLEPIHASMLRHKISKQYLNVPVAKDITLFTVTDNKGNKLIYEHTNGIKLTFLNHCPEIIQNINVALYLERYTHEKYIDSSRFQLSLR